MSRATSGLGDASVLYNHKIVIIGLLKWKPEIFWCTYPQLGHSTLRNIERLQEVSEDHVIWHPLAGAGDEWEKESSTIGPICQSAFLTSSGTASTDRQQSFSFIDHRDQHYQQVCKDTLPRSGRRPGSVDTHGRLTNFDDGVAEVSLNKRA
jgi:hypothetical protein